MRKHNRHMDPDRIRELFNAGKTDREIGDDMGYSFISISRFRSQLGLFRNQLNPARRGPAPRPAAYSQVCPRCRKHHNDRLNMSKWAYCQTCMDYFQYNGWPEV